MDAHLDVGMHTVVVLCAALEERQRSKTFGVLHLAEKTREPNRHKRTTKELVKTRTHPRGRSAQGAEWGLSENALKRSHFCDSNAMILIPSGDG